MNAYYEHIVNNSSMSKEEAIKSAEEISEKHLNAVREFQEVQEIQNIASVGKTRIFSQLNKMEYRQIPVQWI